MKKYADGQAGQDAQQNGALDGRAQITLTNFVDVRGDQVLGVPIQNL